MHKTFIRYLKNDWLLWLVLGLVILNLTLAGWLLFHAESVQEAEPESAQTIQKLYQMTDGLGEMQPVMELLTLHGSIQYYADDDNWLYFEQMAGGFRMMLGRDAEHIQYWEEEIDGIKYSCIKESLGSELAWENDEGYMFYLYSSLNMEHLLNISRHLALRPEGVET